jgi:Nucleotide modification associated domain 1
MDHNGVLEKLSTTYSKKNNDYGDSFSKLYAEFGMTSSIIRLSDKLERLKSLQKNTRMVNNESVEDTLLDMANYAIMTLVEMQKD